MPHMHCKLDFLGQRIISSVFTPFDRSVEIHIQEKYSSQSCPHIKCPRTKRPLSQNIPIIKTPCINVMKCPPDKTSPVTRTVIFSATAQFYVMVLRKICNSQYWLSREIANNMQMHYVQNQSTLMNNTLDAFGMN